VIHQPLPGAEMRAVALRTEGSLPTVCEISVPWAASDEVLVRMTASSLNPHDAMVASGAASRYMDYRYPVVLGTDVCGTVSGFGADVDDLRIGDRVMGLLRERIAARGTFATFAAVPRAWLTPVPDTLSTQDAGALGLAALTAMRCVEAVPVEAGQRALVVGSTGGVGSYLIQLLTTRGVDVTATARSGDQGRHVLDLGASSTVDWTADDIVRAVRRRHRGGVDLVYDLATRDPLQLAATSAMVLISGGAVVSTHHAAPAPSGGLGRAVNVVAEPDQAAVRAIAALAEERVFRAPVTRAVTLSEVPTALPSATTFGKVSVRI
jgi:NADPH:quinone reductase-like Zn-dependent oxidoreductase